MTIDLEQRRKDIAARYAKHGATPPTDARTRGQTPTEPAPPEPVFDPGELTVRDLIVALEVIDDTDTLRRIADTEKRGKDRVTALEAIERRREEIEQDA